MDVDPCGNYKGWSLRHMKYGEHYFITTFNTTGPRKHGATLLISVRQNSPSVAKMKTTVLSSFLDRFRWLLRCCRFRKLLNHAL